MHRNSTPAAGIPAAALFLSLSAPGCFQAWLGIWSRKAINPNTWGNAEYVLAPQRGGKAMGRGILLWLLGVPIPIIILLMFFWHH